MPRRYRAPPKSVTGVEEFCRCPPSHNLSMHNDKGCTAVVVVFRCQTNFYQRGRTMEPHEHDTTCMMKVPCRCKVPNIPKEGGRTIAVSYTHLTLPTICSV